MRSVDLFEAGAARLQMTESIELTRQSLQAHGAEHDHWAIAWSGGKDSSATLTMVIWMIESGMVKRPNRLTVLYADTRMGPLRLESRAWALDRVLDIQSRCRPRVDLINPEEESRIRALIAVETWPNGWSGDEPPADAPLMEHIFSDGSVQPSLFGGDA